MKISLMVLNAGKASGQTIPIPTAQFVIGRDPKCNLRPASAMISKQHCALIVKDGKVYLKDFDSTNGTLVNDQPVKGAVALKHDDVLKVGPLTFKVVIEGQPPVNKPTPAPKPKEAVVADDDPAAALLLALDDDSDEGEPMVSTTEDPDAVPGGSTIMELPAVAQGAQPGETAEGAIDKTATDQKTAPAKPPEKKPSNDSAQNAAQAILDRYKKGRRSS
jgi:pSer/pThr/pTyr-binding forkhead associated (FHA) protein